MENTSLEAGDAIVASRRTSAPLASHTQAPGLPAGTLFAAAFCVFMAQFALTVPAGLALAGAASALLMIDGRPTPKGTPAES